MTLITRTVGSATIQESPTVEPSSFVPRHLSVGAFFDRFGMAKWSILGDTSPTVKAVVADASVRKYIDLDNPQLPAGLAILTAAGHVIDAESILHDDIAPEERP